MARYVVKLPPGNYAVVERKQKTTHAIIVHVANIADVWRVYSLHSSEAEAEEAKKIDPPVGMITTGPFYFSEIKIVPVEGKIVKG